MIDQLYDWLNQFGYIHPLHPPLTHGPIGGVIVAFLLGLTGWLFQRKDLFQSARYAAVIALLLFFPTVIAGLLDWQHYFYGAVIFPFKMKMALALLLLLLLSATTIVDSSAKSPSWLRVTLYSFCLANVLGLGYFGGKLVYEGRVPAAGEKYAAGQKIFISHCSGCHVNGGNILHPNLPLRSAPQLESYDQFIEFVRKPQLPNGEPGPMPAFTPEKITNQQLHELYDYLIHAFAKPTRHR